MAWASVAAAMTSASAAARAASTLGAAVAPHWAAAVAARAGIEIGDEQLVDARQRGQEPRRGSVRSARRRAGRPSCRLLTGERADPRCNRLRLRTYTRPAPGAVNRRARWEARDVCFVDPPADRRPGGGRVPRGAAGRAGRPGRAVLRGRLRHLRPRQRGRARRGPRGAPGSPALLPGPQRAGDGPPGRRLRQGATAHACPGVHDLDRAGRDQHGHWGGHGHGQPPAGAAAARGPLRDAPRGTGPAAARTARVRGRLRQRRLQARVALLGSHQSAGAAPDAPCPPRCACSPRPPRPVP